MAYWFTQVAACITKNHRSEAISSRKHNRKAFSNNQINMSSATSSSHRKQPSFKFKNNRSPNITNACPKMKSSASRTSRGPPLTNPPLKMTVPGHSHSSSKQCNECSSFTPQQLKSVICGSMQCHDSSAFKSLIKTSHLCSKSTRCSCRSTSNSKWQKVMSRPAV